MKKERVTPLPNVTGTLSSPLSVTGCRIGALNVVENKFPCVKQEDESLNRRAALTTISLTIARNGHGSFEVSRFF
ncbi:hypothetical protein VIGAN_08250300 [Vigna angularis var. angularis]|uniref:Uncharacterized protein n=1 Tax=Vigna angularis var. angularis TaxID=157739 RepID=A0A0S3SSC4_PHAAN|nr:hypothetical protein VIGAN_08250300 [Vigna angularis var. angularis]